MLPDDFLHLPVAHRALHDIAANRPENSRAAMRAAIQAGYAIELDLQRSRDGVAMVFHDYQLDRLTGQTGTVQGKASDELREIALLHGDETIPTFADVLDLVNGRVPLLVEIKDQDMALGPIVGPLEEVVAKQLLAYDGPVAVMSFNPNSMAAMQEHAPGIARGITSCSYKTDHWNFLPTERREQLGQIADFDRVGASFISHEWRDLTSPRVTALKDAGVPILCWTIRSPEEEAKAREVAVNITFEDYPAAVPA